MTRRIVRTGPLTAGLGPLAQSIARSRARSRQGSYTRQRAAVPVEAYRSQVRTPIAGGYAAGYVNAQGKVTLMAGPQGLGTIWYPQSAAIATATGAADTSTCALYLGPEGLQTQIGGQSYAGGGDSIGLSVPPLWAGYFIWATWSGGTPGDLATLTVYGEQDALSF